MIDKPANECRRRACYNFAVLKTAEPRSQGNELLGEREERGEAHPGRGCQMMKAGIQGLWQSGRLEADAATSGLWFSLSPSGAARPHCSSPGLLLLLLRQSEIITHRRREEASSLAAVSRVLVLQVLSGQGALCGATLSGGGQSERWRATGYVTSPPASPKQRLSGRAIHARARPPPLLRARALPEHPPSPRVPPDPCLLDNGASRHTEHLAPGHLLLGLYFHLLLPLRPRRGRLRGGGRSTLKFSHLHSTSNRKSSGAWSTMELLQCEDDIMASQMFPQLRYTSSTVSCWS
ncbi:unnamed protein product [Pleuronectes platessa]|uniref:Uncharacterized protein n=1 Tax=Pleuronectes platessa TaxID=8262 RepID=A0A9N7Z4F2_PLEPL|nr:unnamed protein product [Pleuronectes platessa]